MEDEPRRHPVVSHLTGPEPEWYKQGCREAWATWEAAQAQVRQREKGESQ